jgi:hypothetical protein
MYVYSLILEITRRCNIQCRHCLRGKAQSKDMSFETIRKALVGVDSIGTVTFTGGEPGLNVKAIRYFTDYIHVNRIDLGAFYVVTNGKVASRSLAEALTRLSRFCGETDRNGDLEVGGLVMSRDNFHRELGYDQTRARNFYGELPFYHDEERTNDIEMPISEGFAYDNGIGVRSPDINNPVVCQDQDGVDERIEGVVYVNVNGDVIPSCDMSYESQENDKLGNVHEKTLLDIISDHEKTLIDNIEHQTELQEVA